MSADSKQKELLIAIILAAVLVAGSVVFFALQETRVTGNPATTPENTPVAAVTGNAPAIDEKQLTQRIKQEIFNDLQNGEFLQPLIEKGIQKYVQKQQEAQVKAQADQERLANEKAKNVRRFTVNRDHLYGNPDAPITLIEYSDFECPFCKGFHQNVKQLVDGYGGKLNWIYRHYPLEFHNPGAQKEAEASECAGELGGNDAFWKYADAIYQRTTSNGKGFPIEKLAPLAEELGLDKAKFQACLDSGKYAARVKEEFAEGTNSGVSGTPASFFVNNKTGAVKLKTGALPAEALKTEIEQLLK